MEGKVEVLTPESVQISFETAGIGSRFLAMLIDTLIQIGLFIIGILSLVTAGITLDKISGSFFSWYTAVIIVFLFIVFVGYFIFFELILRGRTPGKAAVKIRVIKKNGQPVTFTASLIRNIFRIVDMFPSLYAVGIIVMFASPESRRVGDYAAGTIVVKEYKSDILSITDIAETSTNIAYNPYPLKADEYHLLKEYLQRRDKLSYNERLKLACRLSDHFYEEFHIPQEDRTDREKFLETVYDLNSR